jgi:hypothetical protein
VKRKPGVAATAVVLALALTLVVTACGGNGGGKSAADRESEARDAQLRYAQCMREHGVDVPDPVFEPGGGSLQIGPDPEDIPGGKSALNEAEQACQKHLDDIEPPELSEEEQEEFREASLANARCMREHGIENFPDPTFGEDGGAEIRIDRGSIDPEDPDFREAEEACKDTLPQKPSEESGQ